MTIEFSGNNKSIAGIKPITSYQELGQAPITTTPSPETRTQDIDANSPANPQYYQAMMGISSPANLLEQPRAEASSLLREPTQISQTQPQTEGIDLQARLNNIITPKQRADYLNLARITNRDNPIAPKGYHDLSDPAIQQQFADRLPNTPELQDILSSLQDSGNGFNSKLFVNNEGELFLTIQGTKDIQDILNDVDLARGEIPDQVNSALDLYSKINSYCEENNVDKPTVIGHSLGGFLAQCIPAEKCINFSGPGAGRVVESLRENGTYQRLGLNDAPNAVVNIGSQYDPVYSLVGEDADLNKELDNGVSSPHVTGPNGITLYLNSDRNRGNFMDMEDHYRFWDDLATSTDYNNPGYNPFMEGRDPSLYGEGALISGDDPFRYTTAVENTLPYVNFQNNGNEGRINLQLEF